jgi:hypothetical protein
MPSATLLRLVQEWLAHARSGQPTDLSVDGLGVRIYADAEGVAFIRDDGSVTLEPWYLTPAERWLDPAFRYTVLVTATKTRPALAELLPARPPAATDCVECAASGWVKAAGHELVCSVCHGLGWRSAA